MRPLVGILGALLLAACASGPRGRVARAVDEGDLDEALAGYEELRRSEGADAEVLARVAALVLTREVHGEDDAIREAALTQLALAGTAGTPILRELAGARGLAPTRLGALEILARRDDPDAKLALRALADHEDPAVLAIAVLGMDPALDRALLLEHAEAEDPALRAAAVRRLGPVATEAEVRERLIAIARVDAEASVRAAAVGALRGAGAAAIDALRERLGDPEASVRFAAVGALASASPEHAAAALGPFLEVAVSSAGIEAARLLAEHEDAAVAGRARTFLRQALASADAALRAQAGVALTGLRRDTVAPVDAVREALATERDPEVRLALARALARRDDPLARRALEALLDAEGMSRVQAAALLAEGDHEAARAALAEVLSDRAAPSLSRRTAARALAREAMRPDAARAGLTDEDPFVRVYAAGGILAAAAAS